MSAQEGNATVESITSFTDSMVQVILKPDEYITYEAGQYLQIMVGKEALSYSIANAPTGAHHYELHIKLSSDNANSRVLMSSLKQAGRVVIRLPFGDCKMSHLHPNKPILFIAGGAGFAPIKAMIEQLLANKDPRHFELYWGVRTQSDLYRDEQVRDWQKHIKQFDYYSHFSETSSESLASLVLNRHVTDLTTWQIVVGGPFEMVYSLRDALVVKDVLPEHIFSDAFGFEE